MTWIRKGSREFMQEINKAYVLTVLRERAPISRYDISKVTGLSPTTVGAAVKELMKEGLVHEIGAGESKGGRRPRLLELNGKGGFVVGVGLDSNVAGVVDVWGHLVFKTKPYQVGKGKTMPPSYVSSLVREAIEGSGVPKDKLLGIGVCLPGIVDQAQGVVTYSAVLGWRNIPLKAMLEGEFQLPTLVDTDGVAIAMGEKWFGMAIEERIEDFLYLYIGRGVSVVIVTGGQVYRGFKGTAGEFGHTTVDWNGPLCDCGNRGCIENYTSIPAILSRTKAALKEGEGPGLLELVNGEPENLTFEILLNALEEGEPLSKEIIEDTGRLIGVGMANLVNLLNPQMIIVGGELTRAGDVFFSTITQECTSRSLNIPIEAVKIVPAMSGHSQVDSEIIGGGTLILQELFKIPNVIES
jgi:N-acetylglucosamine repressor